MHFNFFSVQTYSQEEWNAMRFLPYYKNVEQEKSCLYEFE